ncbi:MAG TPA: DUF4337 family protein [Candidatus Baltobacteraceae bacterium]|nr:DUF4337 family protein [Candidatus Baltobacteraceae bacterium]
MAEFNAAHAINEVRERSEQLAEGSKLVPVLAAIIAVCAALATLFANHSSVTGLAKKNEAILAMNKAADQWGYYQAKRIKLEVNKAVLLSGAATSEAGRTQMQKTVAKEDRASKAVLADAQNLQKTSDDEYERSERFMQSYEKYEVSATLFEVSIVLVSLTALMRTKVLLFVAGGATLVGVVFFAQGFIQH